MAEVVSKLRCIVRMDGLYDRFQAAHAWLVHIRYIQAEEIHHALAEENRLSVRSQSPEVARNDVYKLRELPLRSEEHTSELQSLMRISYAVFCLKKKKKKTTKQIHYQTRNIQ